MSAVETKEPEPAESPDDVMSPLTVNWRRGEKEQILKNAADYGAQIGRPVSVAEFVRVRALEPVAS